MGKSKAIPSPAFEVLRSRGDAEKRIQTTLCPITHSSRAVSQALCPRAVPCHRWLADQVACP